MHVCEVECCIRKRIAQQDDEATRKRGSKIIIYTKISFSKEQAKSNVNDVDEGEGRRNPSRNRNPSNTQPKKNSLVSNELTQTTTCPSLPHNLLTHPPTPPSFLPPPPCLFTLSSSLLSASGGIPKPSTAAKLTYPSISLHFALALRTLN